MLIFWFVIVGLFSGIIAGMGMGGGTLLIPMLVIFLGVEQSMAQGINLLVFVPLGIIVGIIYIRSHLIDFKSFLMLAIPAAIVAFIGSFVSLNLQKEVLRKIFAIFLILLGVIQMIVWILKKKKNKSYKKT